MGLESIRVREACTVTFDPGDTWDMNLRECGFDRYDKMRYYITQPCDDPIYNTDFYDECYFSANTLFHVWFNIPRGDNPVVRIEVYDTVPNMLGYWERQLYGSE